MAQDICQGATFEWFDGDTAEIEYVADDGRVFYRDSDGLHKTSVRTLETALDNDTERYALMSWNDNEARGFGENLFA
jgi:hypothetical protein